MGMEEEQGTTPHRTDQRPQTALLALSTSPPHSQCQCRLTCLPPASPTSPPSPPPRPIPGCVLVCAPVGVLETKLFSHESNEMSRESLYHLCACPPIPYSYPCLLPPLPQHFYCVQIVCGAPPTPLATTARSSTTFGTHLPKHFTYSEAKVCDAAPPPPLPSPANAVLVAD